MAITFYNEPEDEFEDSEQDQTLQAVLVLAQSVQALAQQQPTIDLAPIVRLVKQVQESQERIVKHLKEPPQKKKWTFDITKQPSGSMKIEAIEK